MRGLVENSRQLLTSRQYSRQRGAELLRIKFVGAAHVDNARVIERSAVCVVVRQLHWRAVVRAIDSRVGQRGDAETRQTQRVEFGVRGVDERPAVRERDAHAAHGVEQRDARVHQRESGRVDRLGEHVAVGREHFDVDVHLEACGGGRDECGGRGAHQRRCSAGGPAREAGWRQDHR